MSKRSDILDGRVTANLMEKYGLIYTCNCGWIDFGHLTSSNARKEIGAENLWKQIKGEGKPVRKSECSRVVIKPSECRTDPNFRFPDGKTGFLVHYRQDHGGCAIQARPRREVYCKTWVDHYSKKASCVSDF